MNWSMTFSVDKCVVAHFGRNNPWFSYEFNGVTIPDAIRFTDLGILIDERLRFSEHCSAVVKKANRMLGLIFKKVSSRSRKVILPLFRGLGRAGLEYAARFWRPYLQRNIDLVEGVQRRATRVLIGTQGLSYEERLHFLNMFTLDERRCRGDMIEVFKIFNGMDRMDHELLVHRQSTAFTRGHQYRLVRDNARLWCRREFFSNRVVNKWNSLPPEVVNCNTIDTFKKKYDKHVGVNREAIHS